MRKILRYGSVRITIEGHAGVGKSTLCQAIQQAILQRNPEVRIQMPAGLKERNSEVLETALTNVLRTVKDIDIVEQHLPG